MASSTSFFDFASKRYRLAGKAILDAGNPWFARLDQLRAEAEAKGGQLSSFANYDYLGLAGHPVVNKAAEAALARHGAGALGSRLVGGERTMHGDFERAIAEFVGTESCITLVSGYLTNISIIPHLLGSKDLIICDELCHNSILAGARSSKADVLTFAHNDLDHLASVLEANRDSSRHCMIAVEGLYSMDGDLPDLPRLLDLKDKYGAWLLVDEAHSFGVLGEHGRGISEHFGEDPERIELIVGTLSKSLASCGGFLCARKEVIDWLRFTLSGFVYSVGLSPVITAAAHAALDVMKAEPQRTAKLRRVAERFLHHARKADLNTGPAIGRGIVPVMFNSLAETLYASEALLRANIYAPPIVHVGVPKDLPRIRFFLSTTHDGDPAIERAVDVLAQVRRLAGSSGQPAISVAAE